MGPFATDAGTQATAVFGAFVDQQLLGTGETIEELIGVFDAAELIVFAGDGEVGRFNFGGEAHDVPGVEKLVHFGFGLNAGVVHEAQFGKWEKRSRTPNESAARAS